MVDTRLYREKKERCRVEYLDCWGQFWWHNRPPSSSKVTNPLSKEVPVNLFSPPPHPPSPSLYFRVHPRSWCNKQLVTVVIVTACCGEWFVWVVIDLGVLGLFKQSNYWFCLLLCLCAASLCHPRPLCPPCPWRVFLFLPQFSASHLVFIE